MELASRRRRQAPNIWPGFVDALASVIMVIIFVLMIFVAAYVSLSEALSGRDAALEKLNQEISELNRLLQSVRDANTTLEARTAELAASLDQATAARQSLESDLADAQSEIAIIAGERDSLSNQLTEAEARIAAGDAALAERETALSSARDAVAEVTAARDALMARLETSLAELEALIAERARLNEALDAQNAVLSERTRERDTLAKELEGVVAELQSVLAIRGALEAELQSVRTSGAETEQELRARIAALETEATSRNAALDALTTQNAALEGRVAELANTGTESSRLLEERASQIAELRSSVENLRREIETLNAALDAKDAEAAAQKAEILDLGRRLNRALVSKVEELAKYRSEFFGRLREVLGDRRDVRVVGDRFVFQSELLFASGSARIGTEGREQLRQFAATLLEIAADIPPDIDWILRVDGHTDIIPINTDTFPTNWELSTARAVAVVKLLETVGIPPERLSAAGFGEFHPLDTGTDEIALRRNRRIELRLTKR